MPESRDTLFETKHGSGCLLLISVHEGHYIPETLRDQQGRPLGIADSAEFDRHIAIDHGIREVTTRLAEQTSAHIFRATHSRLVADLNRFPDEEECIAPMADGTEIPLNQNLTSEQRELRLAQYFHPLLHGLECFVATIAAANGAEPFVVCMHSFARQLRTDPEHPRQQDVCVFSYPEFAPLPSLEHFVRVLRRQSGLCIGSNEPFSAKTPGLDTPAGDARLASPVSFYNVVQRGNVQDHFALEVCQDQISSQAAQERMADTLAVAMNHAFDFSGAVPLLRSD